MEDRSRRGVQISSLLRPPPPPPPITRFAKMCNPQDESQMASEMGWGPTNDFTEEEASQMAEDLSRPVQQWD
eukprot:5725509-Karenia_brevis.AAC.1